MKKIIIIGTANPYRGGLAAFNERLAKQFTEEGEEVVIYTFTVQYPSFLFPGKTQYTADPCPKWLKTVRKVSSVNPFNWIKVGLEIKKMCPDVVIIPYWLSFMAPCFGTIAGIARSNGKTRLIGMMHNVIPHERTFLDRMLPAYFIHRVDAFLALSDNVAKDIDRFDNENKPKVVSHHPIYDRYGEAIPKEKALEKLGLEKGKKYVLFFGFIRAYKGLDLLLKAMADERLKDVHLIVAGEYYEGSEKYLEIIKEEGIGDRVHLFTEYIEDGEVGNFFSACDVVIQPYKTATQSGVSLIAINFEKPMIVTKVGGLTEFVPDGEAGYNVDTNVESIADGIVRFYEENTSERFAERLKEEKKKYSWESVTANFRKLM